MRHRKANCLLAKWFMSTQFLSACTSKLELSCYARILYDWEGHEIIDLKDGEGYFLNK